MSRSCIARRCLAAVAVVASVLGGAPTAALANSFGFRWSLPAGQYGIGLEYQCTNGSRPTGGYSQYYEYPTSVFNNNPILPNPVSLNAPCTIDFGRIEIYSNPVGQNGDPSGDYGRVAFTVRGSANLGDIPFPTPATAGRLSGKIVARTPVPDGRLSIDIFQTTDLLTTSTGVPITAFSSRPSAGATYRTSPLWDGEYIAVVTDTSTGNRATGLLQVRGQANFDFDLDAPCFGMDACEWVGSVPDSAGGFHPLAPTRVADTRRGLGIPHGPVTPGDGRNPDINYFERLVTYENHELQLAGVGGVPRVGVSAVLLNLTVTGGATDGSLKLFPKPPNAAVFDHQSSFGAIPDSTQLYWKAGEDVPNLVLAKLGVGGKVRIANVSYGPVHVIADVVGWYDQSQPGQSGARLTAVTPERFLDTRNAIGGPTRPFSPGESRNIQVSGRGRIPSGAASVVATVTGVAPTAQTYVTAWPAGTTRFETSVINVAPGAIRPNLVTVAPGSGGAWSLFNERGNHDLLVDVTGYYSTQGGLVTSITPVRVIDTQRSGGQFTPGATRALRVRGVSGVPANAVAVYLNTTIIDGTDGSYLTVWPGGPRPETSNLNWTAGGRRSNLVLVPVAADGTVQMYNAFGNVHVAAEVVAWVG